MIDQKTEICDLAVKIEERAESETEHGLVCMGMSMKVKEESNEQGRRNRSREGVHL